MAYNGAVMGAKIQPVQARSCKKICKHFGISVKIRNFLGSRKRRALHNPHKVAPDVYFKHIWYSKTLSEGFQYIARLKEKSVREAAAELMMWVQRDFIVDTVMGAGEKYRAELDALCRRGFDEKNARLWFALLHKVVQERAASGT